MTFKFRSIGFIMTSFSFLSAAVGLPEQLKGQIDTFTRNPKISDGANIFINTLPLIGAQAKAKLPLEKQTDAIILGRQAYEDVAKTFAKTKIPLETEDLKIVSKHGKDINLRLYKGNKNKVILYIHGGGWRQGSLETHDALCREISKRTGCSVIAVDYRLAPENPFPAGLDDVEEAYEWILKNYGNTKVILCGDSAGGNLAVALTIKLLQEKKQVPNGLLLLYPALDLRIPQVIDGPMDNGYFLTRERITDYVKAYLGKDFKELAKNPQVSPILTSDENLKKFPPTLLIAPEFDPLTASSKEFVEKAQNAGASIDFKVVERTIHIFAQFPELFIKEANEALELLTKKVKTF